MALSSEHGSNEPENMDLFLVRHGEAIAQAADARRPLTAAGRRDVEQVAADAARRGVRVNAILHSGILRAEQTACILGEVLGAGREIRQATGLQPDDDPLIIKAELETQPLPVMIVGHLPHLRHLAATLVLAGPDRDVAEFAPATMVCFSRAGGPWKTLWRIAPERS